MLKQCNAVWYGSVHVYTPICSTRCTRVHIYMQSCWLYTCTHICSLAGCTLVLAQHRTHYAVLVSTLGTEFRLLFHRRHHIAPHPAQFSLHLPFFFFQIFSAFGIIKNAQLRISWPKLPMIPVITMHYWQYSKYWKLQKCVISENSVRHTKPHPHTVCTRYIWLGRKH